MLIRRSKIVGTIESEVMLAEISKRGRRGCLKTRGTRKLLICAFSNVPVTVLSSSNA